MVSVGNKNLIRTLRLLNVSKFDKSISVSQKRDLHKDSGETDNTDNRKKESGVEVTMPPEPTHCCMSGCANCVWIKYAQELAQLFDDGDVIAKNKISEKVQDPKLRAFLFTQLGLNDNATKN